MTVLVLGFLAGLNVGAALATDDALTDAPALCSTDADCAAKFGPAAVELDEYDVAEDTTDDHSNPDPVAECLISKGFSGRPDDGAERIYAPWQEIEFCAAAPGMFNPAVALDASQVIDLRDLTVAATATEDSVAMLTGISPWPVHQIGADDAAA